MGSQLLNDDYIAVRWSTPLYKANKILILWDILKKTGYPTLEVRMFHEIIVSTNEPEDGFIYLRNENNPNNNGILKSFTNFNECIEYLEKMIAENQ